MHMNNPIQDCMFLSCDIRVQSKSTLGSCLNITEIFAQNKRDIGSLSDCNGLKSTTT